MDPKEWGRGFWMLIWVILYNEKLFPHLIEVKKYLDVITRNLPCEFCRSHIAEKISKHNIMSSSSRESLKEFFIHVYKTTSSKGREINIETIYDEKK